MKEKIQFNNPEIKELYEHFNKELKGKLLDGFNEVIKVNNRFISSFKTRLEKVNFVNNEEPEDDFFEAVQLHRKREKELLLLIKKHTESIKNDTINEFFKTYIEAYPEFSSKLQNRITRREVEEKYKLNSKGNPILFVRKTLINSKLWLVYKMSAMTNAIRKLFKKPVTDYTKYRRRRIPFRAMAKMNLVPTLLEKTIDEFPKIMEGRNSALLKLWETDQQLEVWFGKKLSQTQAGNDETVELPSMELFDDLRKQNDTLKKTLQNRLDEIVDEVFIDFDKAMLKVDTIELSPGKYAAREVNHFTKRLDREFTETLVQWNNSTYTLYDDWMMDIEIALLYYSVFEEYYELKNKLSDFISNNLSVNFKQIKGFIDASVERLSKSSKSVKAAREALAYERERLNIDLIDEILTKTIEKLSSNFIEDIEKLKKNTLELVGEVSVKRGFSKNKNYLRGIKDSEISTISPRELLNFEALPHFEDKLEKVKNYVNNHLEKARLNLLSLGTVSDFNLESAQMLLDQKKNASKKSIELASEGYERAMNHLDTSVKLIDEIKLEPLQNLKDAINEFNVEIQKLKNTDNIHDLNLKIARIKAVEQSKKARRDAINTAKTFFKRGVFYTKTYYKKLDQYIVEFKSRFGIQADTTEISFELSEMIRETKTYLKKLPFVYQRLYQLKPTDEDRFFADRKDELGILTRTFDDWQKDRFVSVAILGEKGSGITSFINKFIRSIETESTIIRETIDTKIVTTDEYLKFFGNLLEVETFDSNDDIVKYLSEDEGYKIIILENMQHMFLKQVGGFECLKLFFDLMANTSRKVLWINTYTRHSWEYLDHALKISEYYIRQIELSKLSDKTIEDIIFRRNLLSGYKIIFEGSPEDLENKTFIKMNEDEKQDYLRKSFFSNLNKSCNGNISLALLFWLRSTHEVSDESITIAKLPDIDLSFVRSFSSDYMFTLHAILIHDGLTLENYSDLFNILPHVARNTLIPMLEKGLLIRPKEKFNINPVIFRQVTHLLRSKNFIN